MNRLTLPNTPRSILGRRPGRTLRRFGADRVGIAMLVCLLAIFATGLISLMWTPQDPNESELLARLELPSAAHWLGTDNVGRDILSRLMVATWTALVSCGLALGIAVIGGVSLGLIAGYLEGPVDTIMSRINDTLMSLPPIIFAVGIVGALGPSLRNAMIAVGLLLLPRFFRLTRISTMEAKREDYVEAARACAAGPLRIVSRHILPNILAPLMIQISFGASIAIVSEAGLSFLGLGAQAPQSSWGSMMREGFTNLAESGWMIVPPSVIIVLMILVLSLLGDSLRDAAGR